MLAAPMAGAGDTLLSQVLSMAVKRGLVKAKQHVVCVLSVRGDLVLNVCQVDEKGSGLQSNLASLGESGRHTLLSPVHLIPGPLLLSRAQHTQLDLHA